MRTKEQFKEYVYSKAAQKKSDSRRMNQIWIRCAAAFSLLVILGGVFVYRNSSKNDNIKQSVAGESYGVLSDGAYYGANYSKTLFGRSFDEAGGVNVAECAMDDSDLDFNTVVYNEAGQESISLFSFEEDKNTYLSEKLSVITSGFVNINISQISNDSDALDLAEKEVTINYNQASVFYDSDADVWKIVFSTVETLGDCQTVYLNGDGTTCLIVYGE